MSFFTFQLSSFSPVQSVSLRELNGHDEYLVHDNSTASALLLLNNVIVQQFPVTREQKIEAEKITVADRDYLLAEIYKYTYGPRIESSLICSSCKEKYDLGFSIDDLLKHTGTGRKRIEIDKEGFFCGEGGLRFRLPTGEDELAVIGLDETTATQKMFSRCTINNIAGNNNKVMELMDELGPLLTTEVNVNCPECGSGQSAQFDMQQYLLTRIRNERKKLAVEIHNIAFAYKWSYNEILDLPRPVRQQYAALINHDQ